MKVIFSSLVLAVFVFTTQHTFCQGCSDAGFCTINSFKPSDGDSVEVVKNQIKMGVFYGNADHNITVYGGYFEYNRQLGKRISIDAKLTSLAQNGNDLAVFGLSDFFLNANYAPSENLKFTLGAKIPLTQANKSRNNLPLPMDYQSSLGTFDLIFGVGYAIKKIQFVAAIQQPLSQNNNQFFSSEYPLLSNLSGFQSTNKFQRAGDVLLRISYPVTLTSKLKLTPSLLPIYHLTNDKYTDETNVQREITGSQGLTLNGNFYVDYDLNAKSIIQINVGMPFLVRASRPDGLTRSFIANLEYRIRF